MNSTSDNRGFIKALGQKFYDENNNVLIFRGTNLGDWFIQEFWMATFCVDGFETSRYTMERGRRAMKENPHLTEEEAISLEKQYIDTFIKEEDFQNIKDMGINCLRIPFTYFNLCQEDGITFRENAFEKLDWAIDMCEKYHIYAILDLHAAKGSQNMDHHSGNDREWNLYPSKENMDATVFLWEKVAEHYKDRTIIAGYDLLNEPRSKGHHFAGRQQFDFYDRLYQAIRKIDPNHMIIMECFTFPYHGVHPKKYGWENVAYSYHIYNLTPFSIGLCNRFYKMMHNLKGYKVPIIIGEFSCWSNKKNWIKSLDYFDKLGWSYLSWTYKVNKHQYGFNLHSVTGWGIMEFDLPPVNVHTATYKEISDRIKEISDAPLEKSMLYDLFRERYTKA